MDHKNNSGIRLKGKLKNYILTPVLLTILFAGLDVWMYFLNVAAGLLCTGFVAVYLVVVLLLYRRNKTIIFNEMIDFATQYSTVQRRLLEEFEVPYATSAYWYSGMYGLHWSETHPATRYGTPTQPRPSSLPGRK